MRLAVCAIGLLTLATVASCAHRPVNQAEIDQLNRSIEALRLQNASYAKQVEELENRLFILNDQLESRKVNEERAETPRLPTVALHPTPPAPPPTTAVQVPAGTESAAEPEVEYAGEAAKSTARRPVLRLHGDSGELTVTREPAVAQPTIRVVREGNARPAKEDRPEALSLYRKSFEALRAGRHAEAVQGFREFMHAYPGHDLADNSQYWLAECYYDRKDYGQAVREFRRVIEQYPNGNKVPDALLKVGFSYLALGSLEAGRQTLAQLQRSYPRHEAAVRAAARLAEMDRPTPARSAGDSATAVAPAAKGARASEEVP
jgi:tol-pal system protein YbgF